MKKAIELADTTFRAYKKENGAVALHLRTHLIVYADAKFRAKLRETRPTFPINLNEPMKPLGLSAFLNESPRCWLQLLGRKQCECELSYSCFPVTRSKERPVGTAGKWVTYETEDIADEKCTLFYFSAKMIFRDENIEETSIANMKLVFWINFPGRPSNEKIIIWKKVRVVRRGGGW
jgi:hypothetical protein